jgi:uncharacterized protein
MPGQICINLPVKDLKRSVDFFSQLGFKFNSRFTARHVACMIVSEEILVMLVNENFFQTFTDKPIGVARQYTEVLLGLPCTSRAEVDAMVRKAIAAGGTAPRKAQDLGFMYESDFEDLDGHLWEAYCLEAGATAH